MLRTVRLLAIPATMFVAGSAIAGPYDAYKPPAAPPMSNIDLDQLRVATNTTTPTVATPVQTPDVATNVTTETTETATIDGEQVAQNEVIMTDGVPPMPAQSQGVIIMDSSTQTTVSQPMYQQSYSSGYAAPQQNALPPRSQPFKRMMELERRKNAWLRKTFLNR